MRGLSNDERYILRATWHVEASRELNERLVRRGLLVRVRCSAHGLLSDGCGCEFAYYDGTPLAELALRLDAAARFVGCR